MEKVQIIEFQGKYFGLLDNVKRDDAIYYSAVELIDNKPTQNYAMFKRYDKDGMDWCELVIDDNEMLKAFKLLTNKLLKENKANFFEEGSVIDFAGKDFAILTYIPYKGNMYMMLISQSKPVEIRIARVMHEIDDDEMGILDVTGTDEAVAVIKIHQMVYADK